ncbi:hypothetical protein [Spongiactinospora rosea]|nr:hypothetical protein [Spongiactinospora rosea]
MTTAPDGVCGALSAISSIDAHSNPGKVDIAARRKKMAYFSHW